MDLGNLMDQLAARQAMFWIASAVLALGIACLAASLLMVVRRVRKSTPPLRRKTGVEPVIEEPVTDLPEPQVPVQILDGQAHSAEGPSMAILLRRLQAAGDRLDSIAGDMEAMVSVPNESDLKPRFPGVEYVFKAKGA